MTRRSDIDISPFDGFSHLYDGTLFGMPQILPFWTNQGRIQKLGLGDTSSVRFSVPTQKASRTRRVEGVGNRERYSPP